MRKKIVFSIHHLTLTFMLILLAFTALMSLFVYFNTQEVGKAFIWPVFSRE